MSGPGTRRDSGGREGRERAGRIALIATLALASLALRPRGARTAADEPARPGDPDRDDADDRGEADRQAGDRQGSENSGGGGHGNDSDTAPGDQPASREDIAAGMRGYLAGLALAVLLTAASFGVAKFGVVWGPSVPVALVVLAIAQMGVHLVFFIHITTAPDNTNNVLALAFGTMIVILLIAGSLWIMANLNQNMMPMDQIMRMQR